MVFSDVVGQRHITDTLKKQIETGRLSHAYLFTGTRGTGKTTCAKILAKAANCLNPVGGEPCNACSSCVGINNGSITDVSEIDAASYTGVDNIRAIRDETAYFPSETRMRVYIIDECHMLSAGANNALLKTLEEPPSHVLFILATTELHKVPATILSRCQSFTFKRLQASDIAIRLLEIAAGENIPLGEEAAALISRLADGALRDAISMLDQCAASTAGAIGAEQVLAVLGIAGGAETMRLAKALADRDESTALEILADMYANGKDISALLGELSALLRDLLVLKTTGSNALMTGNYDKEAIKDIDLDKSRLITMILMIQDALSRMQRSQNRRVDAELCLISMCDETLSGGLEGLALRVERLEKRPFAAAEQGARADREDRADRTDRVNRADRSEAPPWESSPDTGARRNAAANPGGEKAAAESADGTPTPRGRAESSGGDRPSASDSDFWQEVLKAVRSKISMSQFSYLATIKAPILQDTRLRILTETVIAQNLLNKQDLLEVINREASAVLGREIKSDVIPADKFFGETKQSSGSDKLDRLIQRGTKFNNITVE